MKKKLKDVISKEFKGLWGTDFSDDGIPVIKTNNMTYEGRIDFSDICIRNIPYKEAENNFLKKGDLIIEKSGGTKTHSVGYVNIFEGEDDKYVCNNFILPLRPNTELVFPKYLFWQLHGMYEAGRFSDCYNKTTGIQNLQKKTYFSKDINLPSKEEQIKIAVHLDKIQSAIDNKKQQLSLLDEAVKSEFVEMFGDPTTNPMNWEIKPMGELLSLLTDFSSNGSYKTLDSNVIMYDEPNYALMIRTTDLESGDFSNNVKWVDEKAYNLLSKSKVFGKEIIMNKIGSAGKVYLMPELNRPVTLGRNAFLFRYKESINSVYIYFLLTSEYGQNEIKPYIRGAVTKTITKDDARKIRIPVPPITLQNNFASFVQKIDKSKFVVKQQITDLQELLDSKMQEYFS